MSLLTSKLKINLSTGYFLLQNYQSTYQLDIFLIKHYQSTYQLGDSDAVIWPADSDINSSCRALICVDKADMRIILHDPQLGKMANQ